MLIMPLGVISICSSGDKNTNQEAKLEKNQLEG